MMTEVTTETRAPEKRWYVIHTYSGYENKVKANLEHRIESMGMEDKIFQVLVPMEDEIEIRQGQRHTVQKKVYPGYVLVEMILDPDSWFVGIRPVSPASSAAPTSRASGASRSRSTRPRSSRSCGTWASRHPSTASPSPRARASA
jgi:transcription termination factor NusG